MSADPYTQLSLVETETLRAWLVDSRRMPVGPGAGPAKLLRQLVKRGLSEQALKPAAALILELDLRCWQEREQAGDERVAA